jgi:hypothetical protein
MELTSEERAIISELINEEIHRLVKSDEGSESKINELEKLMDRITDETENESNNIFDKIRKQNQ